MARRASEMAAVAVAMRTKRATSRAGVKDLFRL